MLTAGPRQASGPDLRVTLVSPGFTPTEGIGMGATRDVAVATTRQRDEVAIPPSAMAPDLVLLRVVTGVSMQAGGVGPGEERQRPSRALGREGAVPVVSKAGCPGPADMTGAIVDSRAA
ncbi:hypothetical protein [Streptomyces sp. NPDC090021]|uniref:hypothetical protein n=1 Tax=Streptomyces sp. NPDC090021 TaxID=3365919 RepID=UPI003830CA87